MAVPYWRSWPILVSSNSTTRIAQWLTILVERIFFQALTLFPNTTIYANAVNDVTVPYVTAAIVLEDPFAESATNGIEINLLEKYSPIIESWNLPTHPPVPTPKPKLLSREWFRSRKTDPKQDRPLLPPFLQFRFPLNILFYALLPLLIPIAICMVYIRLTLAARSSRSRLKLLEKDESYREKLVHMFAQMEHKMENVVADLIDDPAPISEDEESNRAKSTRMSPLSPLQQRIAASLNTLPNLKKQIAYIQGVRNSHAVIVSRDVKSFEHHRVGWGVIRHWANAFVL